MPTYEFRCANGHVFDQFHKMSDAPSTVECPTCGAVAERAISGGAGLVFKGSGFYLTDYGKNAHRGGSPSESKSASSEGGSASSSSESKPAAKPESSGGSSSSGGASGSSGGGSGSGSTGGPAGGSSGASKGDA